MRLQHKVDTVFAVKGANAVFTLLEKPPADSPVVIARKKIFPIPEQRFTSYVGPERPEKVAAGFLHSFEMVPGEVSIFGEWEKDEYFTSYTNGHDEDAPTNLLTIACLKEPAEPPIAFVDLHEEPGGTFAHLIGKPEQHRRNRSFIRLWVDKDPANLDDIKRVARTLAVNVEKEPFYLDFFDFLEIDFPPPSRNGAAVSLIPGTTYHYKVQLLNKLGNHNDFDVVHQFTTKQRTVDITVEGLTVLDDGDAGDDFGEAEFRVMIVKDGTKVGEWKLGDNNNPEEITDALFPLTGRPINLHVNIPPQAGDYRVGVNAHGREFDDFSDERATNSSDPDRGGPSGFFQPWYIPYKTGRSEVEDTTPQSFESTAASLGEMHGFERDTFAFKINGSYSVKYV